MLGGGGGRPWFVTLQLQGISVRFKIDTGADVTVIPESVFKRIRNANLMHSDRILPKLLFMLLGSLMLH